MVETTTATSHAQATPCREPTNPPAAGLPWVIDRRRIHSGENA